MHFERRKDFQNAQNYIFFCQKKKLKQNMRAYGKCSKITNIKNNYFFSVVRNFRNYVSGKVLVFVILECGLYLEQKRYVCL